VTELADRFMSEHAELKRKTSTADFYRDILDRIVKPELGTTKADKLTRIQVGKLHSTLGTTPFQANRVLATIGSMYGFAARAGIVPEGTNPARGIEKFTESHRERFLTGEELERLAARSTRPKLTASRGRWMNPSRTPNTCQSLRSVSLKSIHLLRRRFAC